MVIYVLRHTVNRLNTHAISKYLEQNKATLRREPIKRSKSTKKFEIDVKEDTTNDYEPEKFNDTLNDKYFEYKIESDKNTLMELHLDKIRPYLGNVIDDL